MIDDSINKDVWNKKTIYRIFNIKFFEKEEICDSSTYKEDKERFLISPLRGLK